MDIWGDWSRFWSQGLDFGFSIQFEAAIVHLRQYNVYLFIWLLGFEAVQFFTILVFTVGFQLGFRLGCLLFLKLLWRQGSVDSF